MPLLKEQFDWVENRYKEVLGLAQRGVQAVDKAIDENIPGGEQFTERWATGAQRIGSFVQGEMDAADRQVDEPIDHVGDIPYFLVGAYRRGAQQYTNNARNLATQMGVDPRAGNVLGMVAEGVAEIGLGGLGKAASKITPPGPGLKPAVAGAVPGSAVPTPGVTPKGGPVMEAVTVNNPKVLDTTGRKLGEEIIDNDPELAKHLVKRNSEIIRLQNEITQLEQLKEIFPNSHPKGKAARKRLKKVRPKLYSEESNVLPFTKDDPRQYGSKGKDAVTQKNRFIAQRKAKGLKINEHIEEHHLVLKGASGAAMRKMQQFVAKGEADLDDLVLMAEYAERKGAAIGDRLSNNAFQMKTPHNELHQKVLKQESGSYTGIRSEFDQAKWEEILNEIKTPEELMEFWVDKVDNDYIPNKKLGMIWQDLDDLLTLIRSE
jgi:hypothetical protein